MARIVLVTGGARSGKSGYAQRVAERASGPRTYIATCPRMDDEEMVARIRKHQADRVGRGWTTLEEPLDIGRALRHSAEGVALVDCLSLWVYNLMMQAERDVRPLDEGDVVVLATTVVLAASERAGAVLFVTNEVGLGIVPDNAAARRYRDLLGRVNQTVASGADTVILMTCGLPLVLKGKEIDHDAH